MIFFFPFLFFILFFSYFSNKHNFEYLGFFHLNLLLSALFLTGGISLESVFIFSAISFILFCILLIFKKISISVNLEAIKKSLLFSVSLFVVIFLLKFLSDSLSLNLFRVLSVFDIFKFSLLTILFLPFYYFYNINKNTKLLLLVNRNITLLRKKEYYVPVFIGLICMQFIFIYIKYMGSLATVLSGSLPIKDQVLNILPKIDTSFLHVGIFPAFKGMILISLIFFVRYIPFILFSSILLSVIRSTFVVMTNMGQPQGQPFIDSAYTFGGDLFFSGHTAIPFLWALIFWDNKYLRYLLFIASFIFGLSALLGRFHYSIDVFSAPFFAYGVYSMSKNIFPKYYNITKASFDSTTY